MLALCPKLALDDRNGLKRIFQYQYRNSVSFRASESKSVNIRQFSLVDKRGVMVSAYQGIASAS